MSEVASPTARTRDRTSNPLPESVDVAIVGAGTGGLTAALYLLRRGLSVALFDQHYVAGGCATQFSRGPAAARYNFDVGLHYVGDTDEGAVLPTLLSELGVHQDFVPLDADGFDRLIFPDYTFAIPAKREAYRDRLVADFPSEQRGIDRYMRFLAQVDAFTGELRRADGDVTLRGLMTLLFKAPQVARYKGATLSDLLGACTKDPRLRAVLAGQHGIYGLPPSEVSAPFHAAIVNHFFHGPGYPRGGGQAISDKLAARIEELGGTIHLRQTVERIVMEGGRAVGLVTEPKRGESHEIRARAVLSNADVKTTLFDLVGRQHLSPKYAKTADAWTYPAGLFLTCLGVKADLGELGMKAANYWVLDDWDLDAAYQRGREPGAYEPQGAYITSASVKDPDTPGHAPEGVHNVEVMTLFPGDPQFWGFDGPEAEAWRYRRDGQYSDRKDEIEDKLIARLDDLLPGTAEQVVFRESASPLSHIRYTRAGAGTGYGIAVTPDQFHDRRPHPRSPVRGLYLCGASARQSFGIMGTMLGGRDAARRIGEDLGRPRARPWRDPPHRRGAASVSQSPK